MSLLAQRAAWKSPTKSASRILASRIEEKIVHLRDALDFHVCYCASGCGAETKERNIEEETFGLASDGDDVDHDGHRGWSGLGPSLKQPPKQWLSFWHS